MEETDHLLHPTTFLYQQAACPTMHSGRGSLILVLLVLIGTVGWASCAPPDIIRHRAGSLCNQTTADTVPIPDGGFAFLNGTRVQQLDCGRLDRYEYHIECGLPATTGPWPGWAAGAALLLLIPLRTAWKAYQSEDEPGYLVTVGISAVVPGLTAGLLVILGSLLPPYLVLTVLLTGLALPVAAGAITVHRGGDRRTTAAVVVSATLLSAAAGILATFQYVMIV